MAARNTTVTEIPGHVTQWASSPSHADSPINAVAVSVGGRYDIQPRESEHFGLHGVGQSADSESHAMLTESGVGARRPRPLF